VTLGETPLASPANRLSYRFVILADGKAANALEAAIKGGKWEPGRPLLNPGK
jgi:hypothetical protein